MSVIHLKDINKTYTGAQPLHVLKGVSLDIEAGELVSIMGASGSGKSTLLNILGILDNYDSGEYLLDGTPIKDLSETRAAEYRNKMIGFIFQSFNLMPYYTALENVALPLTFRGVPKAKREKRAKEMLKAVGLETHMNHKPNQMSGGQQQRVGIARALVTQPEIVFADEPTGNLDSKTSDEVMRMISDITRAQGRTLVMVTHDPLMALFADKVVDILDGKIINIKYQEHGAPGEGNA